MDALSPEIWGDAITSVTTILAAFIGAAVVVHQVGKQAKYAIQQSRDAEAQRLRLEVYREVSTAALDTEEKASKLAMVAASAVVQLGAAVENPDIAEHLRPKIRMDELLSTMREFHDAVLGLIRLITRWRIIDVRFDIFRTCYLQTLREVHGIFDVYTELAKAGLPLRSADGVELPWRLPSVTEFDALKAVEAELREAMIFHSLYFSDLVHEAQLVLAGGLFEVSDMPSTRKSLNGGVVVRLSDHQALEAYFARRAMERPQKSRA